MGVVRRYIDSLIILRVLIPTPLVLVLFCSSIPTSLFILKMFFLSCFYYLDCIMIIIITKTWTLLVVNVFVFN